MPKGHNTTSELVEGVRLRHVLAATGKRIPWCDYCNRAMFQFLATEKLCPRNCGKDITALARTMDCTHPGFEEAVWPKIKASLRRKLYDLHRDGNIFIYTDNDGVEQAHWPVQTDRWRRSDWDGRRDCVVPEYIRERLERHGSLADTDNGGQQRGGAYYVFERGRGGRGDARPDMPEALPSPPPPDIAMDDPPRRRPSALSDDGVQQPAGLSDDDLRRPADLSDDGVGRAARQNSFRAPSTRTASEASSGSRRSRGSSGRSRRYAPWNTSEANLFSRRLNDMSMRDDARDRGSRGGSRR